LRVGHQGILLLIDLEPGLDDDQKNLIMDGGQFSDILAFQFTSDQIVIRPLLMAIKSEPGE